MYDISMVTDIYEFDIWQLYALNSFQQNRISLNKDKLQHLYVSFHTDTQFSQGQ